MNLADRIRIIRKDKGLTQDDLAEILGVTRITVVNWESGKFEPSKAKGRQIIRELGVNPEWFSTGNGPAYIRYKQGPRAYPLPVNVSHQNSI